MEVQTYEERAARGARSHQALFRDVNERVREINEAFSEAVPTPTGSASARTTAARSGSS
jgi:hypothetical protein